MRLESRPNRIRTEAEAMLPSGVILVDKYRGWSSSDVVAKLRGVLGARKVGHCGTLDPMATGLLVVCLNSATKLADVFSRHDKDYVASIRLGQQTDTDDSEGRILAEVDPKDISLDDIRVNLPSFVGRQLQTPPAYSAIKVGGVRSYRRARNGETFELKPREVTFHRLHILDWRPPELEVAIRCSAGTYVRALARDLGAKLGVGAHLSGLRRIRSGQFSVDQAKTVDEIEVLFARGSVAGLVTNCLDALTEFPRFALRPCLFARLTQGQTVQIEHPFVEVRAEYCVVVQDPPTDQLVLARPAGSQNLAPSKLIIGNSVPVGG